MSTRELVVDALRLYRGRERTAIELRDELNDEGANSIKLSSLSSTLTKMVHDGTIMRAGRLGSRGGAAYRLRNYTGLYTHGSN